MYQGDITAILDAGGTAVVQYTYDAWGDLLTTTGSMASTLGAYNPLRYRGYVYDTETQLYYLQSRYYNPAMGRFINADAYASTGQGILGTNMFTYCLNNPILFSDYSGDLAKISSCVGIRDKDKEELDNDDIPERDVTEEVMLALTKAAKRAETKRVLLNMFHLGYLLTEGLIYIEFYNLVNHYAPWDIKREIPWQETIGTPHPGYGAEVVFNGTTMTPEMLGNYCYGYLGHAYGIPFKVLVGGSYYAADFPTSGEALVNEIWDWGYIMKGYLDYY